MLLHDDPHWADLAQQFVAKVRDINEFLAALPLDPPQHSHPQRVTYHEACHLAHGQKIRSAPRQLLQSIPGLQLTEMVEADWCCGAAGTYNLTQPEMAGQLARRKLDHSAETGSQIMAVANAGCILHLRQQAALRRESLSIVHPVDLLDQAYQREQR